MKLSRILWAALALGSFLMTGCQKEDAGAPAQGNGVQFTINAHINDTDTKTSIAWDEGVNAYRPSWMPGDRIGIFTMTGAEIYNVNSDMSISEQDLSAGVLSKFKGNLNTVIAGVNTFYTYYPYYSGNNDFGNVTVKISENQYPSETSFDGRSDVLWGTPVDVTVEEGNKNPEFDVFFTRLSSVVKLNLSFEGAPRVFTRVAITVPDTYNISGIRKIDLTTGVLGDFTSAKPYVSATCETARTSVFMNVFPVSFKTGDQIVIEAIGEDFKAIKMLTLKSDVAFVQGMVNVLDVTFAADEIEAVSSEPVVSTVAEFLAAPESETQWYKLTGKITNIGNDYYGNFDLEDATGTVYIHGLTSTKAPSNDKSFGSLGLKVGDEVTIATLRASYNGSPQGGGTPPAYYISHNPAPEPEPEPGVKYSWVLEKGALGSANDPEGTVEIGGLVWAHSANPSGMQMDGSLGRGMQMGTSSSPIGGEYVLSTTATGMKVSEIVVNSSVASKGETTLAVYVNDTPMGEPKNLTTTPTDYSFKLDVAVDSPAVRIVFNNTAKAMYLKSVVFK